MLALVAVILLVIFLMPPREHFLVPKLDIANMAYRSLPGDSPQPREYNWLHDPAANPQIF